MRMKRIFGWMAALILLTVSASFAEEFPLRAEFPDVQVISTRQLQDRFAEVMVVDVRSAFEYGVAHVNGAVNLPVSQATFVADLEKVRPKDGAKPLAFYCNGHACAKSYEAAKAAREAGFGNVLAFDAGIFDWIAVSPEKATLMGKTPASKERILSKEAFKAKLIGFDEFKARAAQPGVVVIDIRDPFQRDRTPEIPMLRNIPLDRLTQLISEKKLKGENFLFLDAVGKQVQWLQYYLEEHGYPNYAFLDKGVDGIK